jgi:zinc transport system substrate-binding protein
MLTIYVMNYPLQYFVDRIADQTVDVRYIVPPDTDLTLWAPTTEAIAQLQLGDLVLFNGATSAKWLAMASLPQSKLVDTSAGFRNQLSEVENAIPQDHDRLGEDTNADMAVTPWLNFDHAIAQADTICVALSQRLPDRATMFQANFASLQHDLQDLDLQLQAMTATNPDIPLLAAPPVYDDLADRYRLKIKSMIWQPAIVPDAVQWHELESVLQVHPAPWMIWAAVPQPTTVMKLEVIGIRSIVFDPAINPPQNGNFIDLMRQNLQNLQQVYRASEF